MIGGIMEFLLKLIMIVIGFNFNGVNVPVVTKGDGLYQDKYEEERYLYKGFNPNNYIVFNKIIFIFKHGKQQKYFNFLKNLKLNALLLI